MTPTWPRVYIPYEDKHEPFVYGTWIRSLWAAVPWKSMRHAEFKPKQRNSIDRLLARPGVKALIACDPSGEPLMGHCVYERDEDGLFLLHYIYVRSMFRVDHIGTGLLRAAGLHVGVEPMAATAWTKGINYQQKRWLVSYDPGRGEMFR